MAERYAELSLAYVYEIRKLKTYWIDWKLNQLEVVSKW